MIKIMSFEELDWPEIRQIYQDGIETNQATFETVAPEWQEFDLSHHNFCRLKAVKADRIVGWAALSPVSKRKVYSGVAELSIYISKNMRGLGIGSEIMEELVAQSEFHGIWTIQASTFPENKGSLRLQENYGFKVVGLREKVAKQHGTWRNTIITERRSKIIGVD